MVKIGDSVKVKVLGFDDRGKVKLSMRQVDQETGEDLGNRRAEPARSRSRRGPNPDPPGRGGDRRRWSGFGALRDGTSPMGATAGTVLRRTEPQFPPVIGHRGAAALRPENTLAGLRRACRWAVAGSSSTCA